MAQHVAKVDRVVGCWTTGYNYYHHYYKGRDEFHSVKVVIDHKSLAWSMNLITSLVVNHHFQP